MAKKTKNVSKVKETPKVVEEVVVAKVEPVVKVDPVPKVEVVEYPVVFAKCKRGGDQSTSGQSCSSKKAYLLTPKGSSVVQFRCQDCGHVWSVAIGGVVNF